MRIGPREGVLLGRIWDASLYPMGTLRRRCATVPQPSELWFWVVRAVGRDIAVLDGGQRSLTGRGGFGGFILHFHNENAIASPTVNCFRFVWFGSVSVCNAWEVQFRIYEGWVRTDSILSRLWTKVHEIFRRCRKPLVLSNALF